MKPTIKSNGHNTYHQDGSVSYWSVYRQQWVREPASRISDKEFAAMNDWDRRRVAQHRFEAEQA